MPAVGIASNIGCIFRGSHVPFEAIFKVRLHPLEAILQLHTEVHLPKIEAILKHCKRNSKVPGSKCFPIACTFAYKIASGNLHTFPPGKLNRFNLAGTRGGFNFLQVQLGGYREVVQLPGERKENNCVQYCLQWKKLGFQNGQDCFNCPKQFPMLSRGAYLLYHKLYPMLYHTLPLGYWVIGLFAKLSVPNQTLKRLPNVNAHVKAQISSEKAAIAPWE